MKRSIWMVRATLIGVLLSVLTCAHNERARSIEELDHALDPAPAQPPTLSHAEALALLVPQFGAPRAKAEEGAMDAASYDARVAQLQKASADSPASIEALASDCLFSRFVDESAVVLAACERFVAKAPNDARAATAVAFLRRYANHVAVSQALFGLVTRVPNVCGDGECAAAQHALCNAMLDDGLAVDGFDADATSAACGHVSAFVQDGPFRSIHVNTPEDLHQRAPLPTTLHQQPTWVAHGVARPARQADPGLYELVAWGKLPAQVWLNVQANGIFSVLIDGVMVAQHHIGEPALEPFAVVVEPGVHEIRFVGVINNEDAPVSLAVLDPHGRAAFSPVAKPPAASSGQPPKRIASNVAASKTQQAPEGLEAALWRYWTSWRRGEDAVHEHAASLAAAFPDSPLVWHAVATAVQRHRGVPARLAFMEAQPLWQRLLARLPQHAVSAYMLAEGAAKERPDDAARLFRAAAKAHPHHADSWRRYLESAHEQGLLDEAQTAAAHLATIDDSVGALRLIARAFNEAGRIDDARTLARRIASLTADERQTIDSERAGGRDVSAKLHDIAHHGSTDDTMLWLDTLAQTSTKDALRELEQQRSLHPHDPALARRQVDFLLAGGDTDAAKRALEGAVLAHLAHAPLRHAARALGVTDPLLLHAPNGFVALAEALRGRTDAAIAAAQRVRDVFPGSAAVALLDSTERFVSATGDAAELRHLVVQLRTKEAIDQLGEFNLRERELVTLRVLKPNGEVAYAEAHDGVEDLSLPALAIGDVIDFATVAYGSGFFDKPRYEAVRMTHGHFPTVLRRVSFDVPADLKSFRIFSTPGIALPEPPRANVETYQRAGVARVRTTFETHDTPEMRREPFTPPIDDVASTVGFLFGDGPEFNPSGGELSDAFFHRGLSLTLKRQARTSPWIGRVANTLCPKKATASDKLARVFRFVLERSKGGTSDDAAYVLAVGEGGRSPLFLALLAACKLDVTAVALHPRGLPPPSRAFEGAYGTTAFEVATADGTQWAIVDGQPVLGRLAPVFAQAWRLPLVRAKDGAISQLPVKSSVVDAEAAASGPARVTLHLKRTVDRSLEGTLLVEVPAYFAETWRAQLRTVEEPELVRFFERALSEVLPGAAVERLRVANLAEVGTALRMGGHVRFVERPDGNGAVRIEQVFADGVAVAFGMGMNWRAGLDVDNRTLPLLLWPQDELLELDLDIGQHGAFTEIPSAIHHDDAQHLVAQEVEVNAGRLKMSRRITRRAARIDPKDWQKARANWTAWRSALSTPLAWIVADTATPHPPTSGL